MNPVIGDRETLTMQILQDWMKVVDDLQHRVERLEQMLPKEASEGSKMPPHEGIARIWRLAKGELCSCPPQNVKAEPCFKHLIEEICAEVS